MHVHKPQLELRSDFSLTFSKDLHYVPHNKKHSDSYHLTPTKWIPIQDVRTAQPTWLANAFVRITKVQKNQAQSAFCSVIFISCVKKLIPYYMCIICTRKKMCLKINHNIDIYMWQMRWWFTCLCFTFSYVHLFTYTTIPDPISVAFKHMLLIQQSSQSHWFTHQWPLFSLL